MSILDLIIEKIGVRTASDRIAEDPEAQVLIASLLTLVARSDGGITPDENMRILNLLGRRYGLSPDEASELVAQAVDEVPNGGQLDELLDSVNEALSRAQKEHLVFMVLCVIAADDKKDAAEMQLLRKLVDTFRLPDATMQKLYEGDFDVVFS